MSKTIEKIAHEHGVVSTYKHAVGSRGTGVVLDHDISDEHISDIAMSRTIKQDGGKTTVVGAAVAVDYETGKINITVPMNASSDSAGYARNQALQHAKKDLMRYKLQQKLAARRQAKVESP
jgi:hypothetical protein